MTLRNRRIRVIGCIVDVFSRCDACGLQLDEVRLVKTDGLFRSGNEGADEVRGRVWVRIREGMSWIQ